MSQLPYDKTTQKKPPYFFDIESRGLMFHLVTDSSSTSKISAWAQTIDFDMRTGVWCMNELVVSDVDSDVTRETNQITGF